MSGHGRPCRWTGYPAAVIEIFGGAGRGAVTRMAALTGINRSTLYTWRRAGAIPDRYRACLFQVARAHGLPLRPEHFFDPDSIRGLPDLPASADEDPTMTRTSEPALPTIVTRMIAGRDQPAVSLRDLHAGLSVGRDFSNWVKDRIAKYDFVAGEDYVVIQDVVSPNLATGRFRPPVPPRLEYYATLNMAKEVAMVEHNERGRAIRRYFIACERRLKEAVMSGAAKPAELDPQEEARWMKRIALAARTIGRAAAADLWRQSPLPQPQTERRSQEDPPEDHGPVGAIDRFLAVWTIRDRTASIAAGELYRAYRDWAEDEGIPPATQNRFRRTLTDRGYRKEKIGTVRYMQLRLRDPDESPTGTVALH
ncbi:MAG: antA/AntB antirepressor family protein [Rhodospirillales bacterium]